MPFNRFPGVDTLLGPEMRSTGEVMGWDRSFPRAFLKAQIGAGTALPDRRHPLRLGQGRRQERRPHRGHPHPARARLPHPRHRRHRSGSSPPHAIPATRVNKVYEGRPHIVDTLKDGGVQIVFNTTEGTQSIAD